VSGFGSPRSSITVTRSITTAPSGSSSVARTTGLRDSAKLARNTADVRIEDTNRSEATFAKLRVARAVRVLAAVQAAAVLLLVAVLRDAGNPGAIRASVAVEIALAMYAGYWSWSIWYEHRARAELEQLRVARVLFDSGAAML
jgi:hypothetical protein